MVTLDWKPYTASTTVKDTPYNRMVWDMAKKAKERLMWQMFGLPDWLEYNKRLRKLFNGEEKA